MSHADFDLAIVGSGFAGSLTALIARRLGLSVVLMERGQHPRFAIGESSTPLANLLWEELSYRYALQRLEPFSKWGSWQRTHPEIGCGLKRGFTFFYHTRGQPLHADPQHQSQLLVAASPRDEVADTHWYRPDFDQFLMREAQAGAEYIDQISLGSSHWEADSCLLNGDRLGRRLSFRARFVLDASGTRGFLHRALELPELPFEHLPPTQTLFTHFRAVQPLAELGVVPKGETPPYPIDDAAVHHVFDGGWVWVLRFNNGLTSAGIAARDNLSRELGLKEGAAGWRRLLQRFPTLGEQFRDAQPTLPFQYRSRLSFRVGQVTGPNWALLPSAVGFVDPLLSTGFTLTLLGVARLAKALEHDWGKPRFVSSLEQYARQTTQELLVTERLIAALYASMDDFPTFSRLALLYFAAVSYAEISGRLQRRDLTASFLLHDDPQFGPQARACCQEAMRLSGSPGSSAERGLLHERILQTIAPIDLIGLGNRERRNWYPVQEHHTI